MVIKVLFYTIISLVVSLTQTMIVESYPIVNVQANLFLVVVVSVATIRPKNEALALGIILGFVMDSINGSWMGFYTFLMYIVANVVIIVKRGLFRENAVVAATLTFIITIFFELIVYSLRVMIQNPGTLSYSFKNIIIPEALANFVLIFPVVWLIKKFVPYLDGTRRKRRY